MHLSLTGMSGSGKSFWSARLAQHGFTCFCCDDRIAEKLAPFLDGEGDTIARLGRWMGFPFQPGYEEREVRYLLLERETVEEALRVLNCNPDSGADDVVIDTTGSVVYMEEEILAELRRLTTIVHLATPVEVHMQMLENYRSAPRPVLWRGMFVKTPPETDQEALARCYPELLAGREKLYRMFADVTLDYFKHRGRGFGVTEFLAEVRRVADAKACRRHR